MSNYQLAINTATSPEILALLANDEDWWVVRQGVAYNTNTPPETLELLANDEDPWVREEVARNPNTPQYIKTYLKLRNFYTSCTK